MRLRFLTIRDAAFQVGRVGHCVTNVRKIHAAGLDEFVLELLDSFTALWRGHPDKSQSLNLMIAHGGVEENVA